MSESVSVIIPCYRVGAYLPRAVACLRAQTYAGPWEAIFVDDGDPAAFENLDLTPPAGAAFRLVHQANGGLCAARNTGLRQATGEIILFMDPDDEVGPNWIERLVAGLQGVDLAWGGFTSVCEGHLQDRTSPDVGAVYEGEAVKRRVWRAVFGYRLRDVIRYLTPTRLWKGCEREFVGLWSRGYRRSVLDGLLFDETLGLFEDAIFVAEYAVRARSMRIIGETGYRYTIRPGGLMSRESRERKVRHKFELRDARRRVDPKMTHWRGTFYLSALEILRLTHSPIQMLRYLRNK